MDYIRLYVKKTSDPNLLDVCVGASFLVNLKNLPTDGTVVSPTKVYILDVESVAMPKTKLLYLLLKNPAFTTWGWWFIPIFTQVLYIPGWLSRRIS